MRGRFFKKIKSKVFDASFLSFSARSRDEREWMEKGAKMALELFHKAAERVPAYRHFLKMNGINHAAVRTIEDFKKVPQTDKNNYLRVYKLSEMCWDGHLHKGAIVSASSGSTGKPFMWPRYEAQEKEIAAQHEIIMKGIFHADSISTLFVDSFSMGMYIAGVITSNCALSFAHKGNPVCVVTPGLEIENIIRIIKDLSPNFGQVIIAGYPPFVKDILDIGAQEGIDWRSMRIKFLFAAEGFTEKWREHVHGIVGSGDHLTTSINIYGSADASLLGHETPFSILIKRAAGVFPDLERVLFRENGRTQTLVHFYPNHRYFENVNGELIFSAPSGIPLLRYNIHDSGDIIMPSAARALLGEAGINYKDELWKSGAANFDWNIPFLYLYGRSDFAVSFYGLKIFPEHVKAALAHPEIFKFCTGKSKMDVKADSAFNQELNIILELKNGIDAGSKELFEARDSLAEIIFDGIKKSNEEYTTLSANRKDKAKPKLIFKNFRDSQYFAPGIKHRWQ